MTTAQAQRLIEALNVLQDLEKRNGEQGEYTQLTLLLCQLLLAAGQTYLVPGDDTLDGQPVQQYLLVSKEQLTLFDFLMLLSLVYDTLGDNLTLCQLLVEHGVALEQFQYQVEHVVQPSLRDALATLVGLGAVAIDYPTSEDFSRMGKKKELPDADV
jgi:hypothetical protein